MSEYHTLRNFDSELQVIEGTVAEMGGLVEKQAADAVTALVRRDPVQAERVVSTDIQIDELQHEIEHNAVISIARRQPVAGDLRELVGAMRLSNDLERIGDLAKNIAKRVLALKTEFPPPELTVGIQRMNDLLLAQLKNVLNAYCQRSDSDALDVWRADEQIDALCSSVFRELLTYMMEDPRNVTFCIHLLFCGKNIERMGDHATNIAEAVHYIVCGTPIFEQRPKGDITTSISPI